MNLKAIKNDKSKPLSHQVIVHVLFKLRRYYKITIHSVRADFFHIKKGDQVIGFACSQIMAIDKAFSFIGVLPPHLMEQMINKKYQELAECKEVVYG